MFATTGGPEKVRLCRDLGAEIAIDYRDQDFAGIVNEATEGEGANVIYWNRPAQLIDLTVAGRIDFYLSSEQVMHEGKERTMYRMVGQVDDTND